MAVTLVEAAPGITGGVDTGSDKTLAAALGPLGRPVGTAYFSADAGWVSPRPEGDQRVTALDRVTISKQVKWDAGTRDDAARTERVL